MTDNSPVHQNLKELLGWSCCRSVKE